MNIRPGRPSRGKSVVLSVSPSKRSQATVWRHYLRWRDERGVPLRCDEPMCTFHTAPLVWNGKPLKLILDHRHGNKYDNTGANLRLLCPNCDSQLPTRGGANRGRVVAVVEGGYTLRNKDGTFVVAASIVPATFRLMSSPLRARQSTTTTNK